MLTIECPEGKLYPVSVINLNSFGLGLCTTFFNIIFNTVLISKFIITAIPIFLFFSTTSKIIVIDIRLIVPPKLVIIFAIGVTKSEIR